MAHDNRWQYFSQRSLGVVGAIAFGVLALQLAALQNSGAQGTGVVFPDFPSRIECEAGGTHHAYYLSKVDAAGVATYATLGGQAGTITLTGKIEQVGGDISSSCAGKTLEQLRSSGQAYYLRP